MAGRKSGHQLFLSVLLLPVGGGEDDIDTRNKEITEMTASGAFVTEKSQDLQLQLLQTV